MQDGKQAIEASPIHRAVWESELPAELFTVAAGTMSAAQRVVLDRSLDVVRRRRLTRTLYDARGIVSDDTIRELGAAGYWGLRVEARFGGAGASFATLVHAITEMMLADPWVAGMASTQAALGPVGSLEDFGTPEQKERLLPPLARGARLGAFAVTEPVTSSDWTRIRTVARRAGDRLLLTGEKVFITNAAPGRTISLLCRVDDRFEQLVVELPDREDEHFQIVEYKLRAPAHLANVGLRFRELPVPAANVLVAATGDGRTIAHRALNHGRSAVCAFSAGMLRQIAGALIPWVRRRETFGAPIGTRELVRRRLGRLAARIVACDALSAWTASLLDQGYRGELEGVTAKVFASEAVKEATLDILLKTEGGRALLEGSLFADTIHDLLAPTVYEGENEILTLGFFASLSRAHGRHYFAAITDAARSAGHERVDLSDPRVLWAARGPLSSYAAWVIEHRARQLGSAMPRTVRVDAGALTALARDVLHGSALEISQMMRHHGPELALRQAAAHELATRVQRATVLMVVSQYAAHHADPLVANAGLCMAMELGQALLGTRPSAEYQRLVTEVGAAVAEDRFAPVAGAERSAIEMAEGLPPRDAVAAARAGVG